MTNPHDRLKTRLFDIKKSCFVKNKNENGNIPHLVLSHLKNHFVKLCMHRYFEVDINHSLSSFVHSNSELIQSVQIAHVFSITKMMSLTSNLLYITLIFAI